MLKSIKKLMRSGTDAPRFSVPPGTRFYAIGDIHGRHDLFKALIKAIDAECEEACNLDTQVILLGDLVDRGPASAKVVSAARKWQKRRPVRILAGNHEEMFLKSFDDIKVLRHFLRHGGRETILSYGLDEKTYNNATLEELHQILGGLVPEKDRAFMSQFEEMIEAGDYVFVHAGIRPEVPLEEQKRDDLLWIRERFLDYRNPHPRMVVHGHTIFEQVDSRPNRVGIDTGAFRFGRLTALVLEGDKQRLIQACEGEDAVVIEKRDTLT